MRPLLLLSLLLLTLLPATYAQPSAGLHGVVTDESGALVPGATVTVANAAGPVKSATSGNDGSYSVNGLVPGSYTVTASSPGLQQLQPTAVNLNTSQSVAADLQMRVVAEKQEVTVQENSGPAVSVDPSSNAGALVLRGADLQALSDDPDDLQADLQALAGPSAGPSGGQIYIDGFTGGTLPSKDSIREIRINQNPFSPEYDKLGYGRIEILTKPGTDKLHGNLFTDFGDDIFNSRNPYAAEKAPFMQRTFGGSVSGALGKKASFFVDLQDREVHNGNVINGVGVGAAPDFAVTPFNQVFEAPQNRFRISPRLDYQLSPNNTLTVRYGYTRNDLENQGVGNLSILTRAYHSLNTDHTVQVVETAVLGTKVINETRFQFFHQEGDDLAVSNLPGVTVAGAFNGGGSPVGVSSDTENHYEVQNNTTISGGAHTWKFGIRLRAVTIDNVSPQNFSGTYAFNGAYAPIIDGEGHPVASGVNCDQTTPDPADCVLLTSIEVYQRTLQLQSLGLNAAQIQKLGGGPAQFNISQGNPLADVGQVDIGAFVGDDWRVKPNFTLSLGLRYETQTNIHDWHDWAPRIGFAWAPGQSKNNPRPKTVLRGGFGMFYDRFSEQNILTAERYNGILQQQYVITQSATNPIPFTPDVIGSPVPLPPQSPQTIQLIDSHLRAPYILQEAFTVERQLPRNSTISVSYVNSHGLHEFRSTDINAPALGSYTGPGTGVFPLAAQYGEGPVLLMQSTGLYNQWQLITNVRTQVNKRISLNGYYQYGRAKSNTDGVGTLPANPYSMDGEYGPSSLDSHNRAFIGGSITGPWAVTLAPFFTADSGAPFNITTGTDPYGTTLFNARPGISSVPTPYQFDGLYLDPNPKPGDPLLPRNFGRSPGNVSFNLRVAKTFGFGGSREASARNRNNNQDFGGGGPGGGGGGRGPGGGGPGGGGFPGGGAGGGGPQAFFRGFGGGNTGQRYNLTISVQARNLLNHVNPGPVNGIISSPLFGESNSLAGGFGAFAQSGNNRRIDLQARFTF